MNTLLHHNHCCLWEGGMVRSPSVTWPLLFSWQPEVPLWIGQSLQWRLCPCPASGCSAAPPAGPSVACGPMLRGEALWELAVRRLSPGTPSWCHSACTQGATTAAAATAWSSLFWETITGRVFPTGIFQNLSINQKNTHMQHWDSGDRMEISSLECFPNLGRKIWWKKTNKAEFFSTKKLGFFPRWCVVSPSGIIQVQWESFLTEFGKDFIMMSVHVACESRKVHKDDSDCESASAHLNDG